MAAHLEALKSRLLSTRREVRIVRLGVRALRVPLERPVGSGVTSIASRDYLAVELKFSDGSHGIGFSYIGTLGALTAASAVRELLVPLLGDGFADADDPFGVHRRLFEATRIQGRSGIVMNAISAVDIAIWDGCARRRELPLGVLLGATRTSVPAYASGGYYYSSDGVAELEPELARWVELGFDRIKLKVRGAQSDAEFERLRLARAAVGSRGTVMLDFYHAFSSRDVAWAFVERAAEIAPYWIEDPFDADDLESFAWLARRSGLRVATGEFQSSATAFAYVGQIGAAAVVQAEAPRCGGVTGWLQIADLAARYGMTMSPCWFHQLHVHLVPSVPNGGFVEYFVGTEVLNFDRLIDRTLQPAAGSVTIPDQPGIGFDFDPAALRRFAI